MSLADKKKILCDLPKLGLATREFANCAQDFVEGKSVEKYFPSAEEAARRIEQLMDTNEDRLSVHDGWLCLESGGRNSKLYLIACRQTGNELQMKVVPSTDPNLLCGTEPVLSLAPLTSAKGAISHSQMNRA